MSHCAWEVQSSVSLSDNVIRHEELINFVCGNGQTKQGGGQGERNNTGGWGGRRCGVTHGFVRLFVHARAFLWFLRDCRM